MKFAHRSIQALKPKADRYDVWVDGGGGLGIRVSTKDRKSWIHLYRFEGRMRRKTLGVYPHMTLAGANAAHGEAQAKLEKGIDPGALHIERKRRARIAETVEDLTAEYIEKWARPHK